MGSSTRKDPLYRTLFQRGVSFIYETCVRPRSTDEDAKRREFVLNVLLLTTILLVGILFIVALKERIELGSTYRGIPLAIVMACLVFFSGLLVISRNRYFTFSAYALLAIYFFPITYGLYHWGADMPMGLLLYALVIVMSSVLVSTRFSFFVLACSTMALMGISYLQTHHIAAPMQYWKTQIYSMTDSASALVTLGIIAAVSWLSNREIERSLIRARRSEAELKVERDQLEVKVEERTRALTAAQLEKMREINRFAEFGRLASGFFHDLSNPLTAVSLNLEMLKDGHEPEIADARSHLDMALSATKRAEGFITAIRKQIQHQETRSVYSLVEEVKQVIQVMSYNARKYGIDIDLSVVQDVRMYGDLLKFNQIVMNLISNAIDAYDQQKAPETSRKIAVTLAEKDRIVRLTVRDWGVGIPPQHLKKIFDPLFTTKSIEKGTGIGLSTTKEILERDFSGTIRVESREGEGTTFIVEFPLAEAPRV